MSRSKQIKRKVRQYRGELERNLLQDICRLPFKYRWNVAWKIIFKKFKSKSRRARRERKRVLKRGHQNLTKPKQTNSN